MRITRVYLDAPLSLNTTVILDDRAAHHVARVLRMKPGTDIRLFDGRGTEVQATLSEVSKRCVTAQVNSNIETCRKSPLKITLGQGISKGERMDFTLQKSVELGVAEITPLWTDHSQVRLDEKRQAKRIEHWRGVIISACEQCGRSTLPTLLPPMSVLDWVKEKPATDTGLLLDPEQNETLPDIAAPDGPVHLLIGPEGGLSRQECAQAAAAGFRGIGLGPRVLRTETAALAAIAAIQTLWGDFR